MGMPDEAILCLKSAIQIDPDDEMLHIILAENFFVLGRMEEGQEYVDKARELDRRNPLKDYSGILIMMEKSYGSSVVLNEKHTGKVSS
jgi:tetratricopeptide (TPR) repeat protein